MAVPDYQSLMLPLLKMVRDGQEHSFSVLVDGLAVQLKLTDDDKKEMLPSGGQTKFDNRVRWAGTFLKKAGLLESTGRGKICITKRGLDLLKSNPPSINAKFLEQYPEFLEFRSASRHSNKQSEVEDDGPAQTPQEMLESSYLNLRRNLAQELMERVKNCPPRFFEKLVVDLLVAMGYGGSRRDASQAVVGRSGDEGIDGIIKEDKLGLDVVYIQAKRWEATVGSLEGQRARKGVLITTSQFSQEAKDYVNKIEKKIVLIDGEQLAQFMIDHGIGVTEVASYTIKKADLDYFGDE
jgi:restriction system protein